MSAKPSLVPRWNTGGANNVEPSPTKKILGWITGEKPKASYWNWWQKLGGEWFQYLSDGALTGAHTFASTVQISGALTALSTLAVAGASTLTGAVSALSTLAVTGLITATAGVTAAVNQHFTTSGTGTTKHGDHDLLIPPIGVASNGNVAYDFSNRWIASTGVGSYAVMVPVVGGQRFKSMTCDIYGNSSCNIVANLVRLEAAGGSTVASSNATPSAAWTTLTVTPSPAWSAFALTGAMDCVVIYFEFGATGGRVRRIKINYDRP